MAKPFVIALLFLVCAASSGSAQSISGSNFGAPPGGSAASRSGGGHVYTRHRESGGSQNAQDSGGSRNGGGEKDARDSGGSAPVARSICACNRRVSRLTCNGSRTGQPRTGRIW